MQRYTTNPQVIHETIEGETIIINLVSGSYYSLQGAGPAIWNQLSEGASAAEVVDWLVGAHSGGRAVVEASVGTFLAELEAEQLIAPGAGAGTTATTATTVAPESFDQPKLEKYTDMQDIILLDPVHQVDNRGWPHAAPSS